VKTPFFFPGNHGKIYRENPIKIGLFAHFEFKKQFANLLNKKLLCFNAGNINYETDSIFSSCYSATISVLQIYSSKIIMKYDPIYLRKFGVGYLFYF